MEIPNTPKMEELVLIKYSLEQERDQKLKPLLNKRKHIEAELDEVNKQIGTISNDPEIKRIQTRMKHLAKATEISASIEGFANLKNPDEEDPRYSSWTYAEGWFMGNRYCGYALYVDGVFELYSNAGRPGDTHSPKRREVPFKHHFDYYEAHLIAKDATLSKEVRVQKLRDMLEAFYPGFYEEDDDELQY